MSDSETNELTLLEPVIAARPTDISLIDRDEDTQAVSDIGFDLEGMGQDRRDELKRLKEMIIGGHRDLTVLAVHSALRALRIGEYAMEAKAILGHGQFHKWIEAELSPHSGLSVRTIQRYIKLARNSELLLHRVGQLYCGADEEKPDFENAQDVLRGLNLEDAFCILRLGSMRVQPRSSSSDYDASPYQKAAAHFFAIANVPFQTHLSWQSESSKPACEYQLVVPLDGRQNRLAVIETLKAYQSGTILEALLLLSGGGASHWLHCLDAFPRILIRRDEYDEKQFLFGLIGCSRFADFNDAFNDLGAVLVPFTR